ncbi:hypothetical protein [Bradyrhizobium sp. AZCC 1708]|uniref:hypothetical protein n=1 Tax=Bradyrhizobium sp. AZCC 1708 TaxID=3117015 RepID=UPI002FF1D58B
MEWFRKRGGVRLLLAGLLALQPGFALAQDAPQARGAAAEFRDLLQQELSSIRQELADQRQLLDYLTQQVMRGGVNRAQLEQTLASNKTQLQSALESAKGDLGQQLKDAVSKFNPDAVKSLTSTSPKEEVDKALGGLQEGLTQVENIKRKAATDLQQALSKAQCLKDLSLEKVLQQCRAKVPSLDPRLIQAMGPNASTGWTSELVSRLPDACVPECLKDLQDLRDKYRQAEAAGQQAALMANTLLLMAMQTGNPYVMAAAVIIAVLIAAFSSGKGGGDGDGKGRGPGRQNQIANSGGTPAQPRPVAPGPQVDPVSGVSIAPGKGIKVSGEWPRLNLTDGKATVMVDFTEVYEKADPTRKLSVAKGRVTLLEASISADSASVTIETDNPNKPAERTKFDLAGKKEGDKVSKWIADIDIQH